MAEIRCLAVEHVLGAAAFVDARQHDPGLRVLALGHGDAGARVLVAVFELAF